MIKKFFISMKRSEEAPVKQDRYPSFRSTEVKERVREEVLEKGQRHHKIVYKTVRPQDKFKGLKASDFDLEVLISLGALDGMKECRLTGSNLEDADNIEGSIDNLFSAVDREENLNKGGNE